MNDTLHVALVGCGAIADILADVVYPNVSGMKIAAVVDRDIDRAKMFGERFDAPAFRTMKEAAEAVDFDAFDLRVPHHLHHDLSIEALGMDKHVLVEKPMGVNAVEARKMLEEAQKKEKVFAVGENYDFLESMQLAKKIIASGEIGKPVFAQVYRLFRLGEEWRHSGWRGCDSGNGGPLMENGCHIARMVEILVGRITKVSAFQNTYPLGKYPGDCVAVAFETDSNVIGTQAISWTVGVPRLVMPEIRIVGVDGYVEVWVDYNGTKGGVAVCSLDGSKRWIPVPQLFYASLAGVMQTFVQGCNGGSLQGITAEQGLADVEVTDKIFDAIKAKSSWRNQ